MTSRFFLHCAITFILMLPVVATPQDHESATSEPRILFIRGGPGTGGFLEGGADEQLSDINDTSTSSGNHGWATLAGVLRDEGYVLEQVIEENEAEPAPVPLESMDLSQYAVIVFGSNNRAYGSDAVDAVEAYIRGGGGALFISDANWGTDWHVAPDSDQHFLDRFGWRMNQDTGTYAISDSEFIGDPHPILEGAASFDGEGVSPITVEDNDIPGVSSRVLAPAKGNVRRNTTTGAGPATPATANDGSLVIATADQGRIAGHFDRNTFFNQNGAGTNITRLSNAQYARNLFKWLAGDAVGGESNVMSIQ
jgi:hypothetical protein